MGRERVSGLPFANAHGCVCCTSEQKHGHLSLIVALQTKLCGSRCTGSGGGMGCGDGGMSGGGGHVWWGGMCGGGHWWEDMGSDGRMGCGEEHQWR